jgi:hypothetical protein
LRQTSRSFHAIVAPYRFRIVAVHGLLNMLSLGTLLADLPNKDRRIEHLYISVAGSGDDLAALHDSLPSLSLLEFETTIKNQIKDLLQRTAPDLGSDQQGTTEDAQHPFHQLFAVLCALSMHTVRSISIFSDQSRDEFINWAWYNFTFPALEKLYVFHSSFARDCVLSKVAPHMPATAPRLHTVHIGFASLHDAEVQLMNMAFEREAHWVQIPLVILEGRPVQWYVEEGVKQILEWTADDDRSLHKTAPAAHLHLIGVNAFNNPNYYKYDEEDNRQEAWRGLRQIVSAHKRTAQEAGEEPWVSHLLCFISSLSNSNIADIVGAA